MTPRAGTASVSCVSSSVSERDPIVTVSTWLSPTTQMSAW